MWAALRVEVARVAVQERAHLVHRVDRTGLVDGLDRHHRDVLVVPPDKGYGEQGSEPSIPGNATLIFVVDILSAQG